MKRLTVVLAPLALIASLLLAQATAPATLRLPTGDKPVAMSQQGGVTFFAADQLLAAFGGTITPSGTDSRFAVVRDELIEMPVVPLVIDGHPYVPLQFFQGFLPRAAQVDLT